MCQFARVLKHTAPIALFVLLSVSCATVNTTGPSESEEEATSQENNELNIPQEIWRRDSRTYYDTLDLDTPESAVLQFTGAFQHKDFLTVYLILSTDSQFRFTQELRSLNYKYLINAERLEEVLSDMSITSRGIGRGEHWDDAWYLFDEMMLSAVNHNALLIDLCGEAALVGRKPSETVNNLDAIDVIANVDGIEGEVIFRMIQSPSGRWRVFQVITPGGDEEVWPWAVPNPEAELITIEAVAEIQIPCTESPPPVSEERIGEAYLIADPTCGELAKDDGTPGSTLTLFGDNFSPNTETTIMWTDPLGNQFRHRENDRYVVVTTDEVGAFTLDVVLPFRLLPSGGSEDFTMWKVHAVQQVSPAQ